MSTFEFVSILVSIVVGLGVTRILTGLSSLFEHRHRLRADALTLAWAAVVLIFHIMFWWTVVGTGAGRGSWTLVEFVALFLYATAVYFTAALIVPESCAPGLDLRERYESIRRPFFGTWLAIVGLDVTDTVLKGGWHRVFVEFGAPYVALMGTGVACATVAMVSRNRRVHWGVLLVMLCGDLGWSIHHFRRM